MRSGKERGDLMSSEYVWAPWNPEQVRLLNMYQKSGRYHPHTCGGGGGPCSGIDLTATSKGWVCPRCGLLYAGVGQDVLDFAKKLDDLGWPNLRGVPQKQRIEAAIEGEANNAD